MTVQLRGHHLLCLLTYVGRGYSPAFVRNYDAIAVRLSRGEPVELCEGPDDICAPLCGEDAVHCTLKRVNKRDDLALRQIGEVLGKVLAAVDRLLLTPHTLAALREAFAKDEIRAACKGCQWHGFCAQIAENGFRDAHLRLISPVSSAVV